MMKTVIHQVLARLGYRLVRHSGDFAPVQRLPNVDVVFDVGVGRGTDFLYDRFPSAEYFLFEPNTEFHPIIHREILPRINATLYGCALAAEGGTALLRLLNERSTFLNPTEIERFPDASESPVESRVDMRTLDEVIDELAVDLSTSVGLLKLDTEGFELEVLRGAERHLRDFTYVIAEVSSSPRYDNGYSLDEFMAFMGERGFAFHEFLTACYDHEFRMYTSVDIIFRRVDRGPGVGDSGSEG